MNGLSGEALPLQARSPAQRESFTELEAVSCIPSPLAMAGIGGIGLCAAILLAAVIWTTSMALQRMRAGGA
jgi:hypothetical protein